MNKINGYTEEEAKNLVEFIKDGKQKGKTLTYLFELYGLQNGRAKGSVRNYYYALMKNEKQDAELKAKNEITEPMFSLLGSFHIDNGL